MKGIILTVAAVVGMAAFGFERLATERYVNEVAGNISPTNPTFSNAVLAVGLNIDTNSVAVLNEIAATFGGFPIAGTATTVGGLLAALAAAIAWLRKRKIDTLACSGVANITTQNGTADVSTLFSSENTSYNASVIKISADPDAPTVKAYIDAKLGEIENALNHVLGGN